MARHPNKHLQAAIEYAQEHGWTMTMSNGHAYGILWCPNACRCHKSVPSTPRVPEHHARRIRRAVDQCPK